MEHGAPESGHGAPAADHHGGLAAKAPLYCGLILVSWALGFLGQTADARTGPQFGPVPVAFILFGITLLGVALFHHFTLQVALSGVTSILIFKFAFTQFHLGHHIQHEWVVLVNLLCLLLGFALLANHFEQSRVPDALPKWLPNGWTGGLVLLVLVFVLSTFLDNIAAAMIGATVAKVVFKGRVHIGFLAAVVAASNAGGAGSVVGDTTTTMMWIDGVSPMDVLHAFVPATVALAFFGVVAAKQQDRFQRIQADPTAGATIDWGRVGIVGVVLAFAITVNVIVNVKFNEVSDLFPFIGVAIAVALLGTAPLRKPAWELLPGAFKGSCFLLSLVLCASMMPVEKLPPAAPGTAFGLGFLSAVFDNIPLTKLALAQGGYDWGALAYAVGFGGSMIWFGSSAGVAVSNFFPEAKSVANWLRHGWHIAVAYVLGFAVFVAWPGWHPHASHKVKPGAAGQGTHGVVSPGHGAAGPGPGHAKSGSPAHGEPEKKR
ncbi:MAG: hypothetical protein L0216_09500 [Planctomycetales bacterium]|nr:hypothetical protein [Planctomycetales bacterium]